MINPRGIFLYVFDRLPVETFVSILSSVLPTPPPPYFSHVNRGRPCCAQVSLDAPVSEIAAHVKTFAAALKAGIDGAEMSFKHTGADGIAYEGKDVSGGYFGDFGGRYIPETLVEAHR